MGFIDRPPPDPMARQVGFLLSWTGQRWGRDLDAVLAPLGLQRRLFGVLNFIDRAPGSTQQELGGGALIDASSMVALIDELEVRGLAERRPHPEDRRKRAVHLTAKGRRTLDRARAAAVARQEELLAPLDEGERKTLLALLRRVARVD